jgi:hypothetical protein
MNDIGMDEALRRHEAEGQAFALLTERKMKPLRNLMQRR